MKINDKDKGIVPSVSDENFTVPELLVDESDIAAAMVEEEKKRRKQNALARAEWNSQGKENLDVILYVPNAIASRLDYLLKQKRIEKAVFARQVGLGRTTIHRYINGDSTPNKKKLLQIIDALSMSVADFCYEPKDFEKWKAALEPTNFQGRDIIDFRDEILDILSRNNFVYRHNGKTMRLPHKHYVLLKSIFESGFNVLDLLPHDEGFFR